MSRFLLAWEVGSGYGHLTMLLQLADELARRGHEPVFASRNLVNAEIVLGRRGYRVLQAPTWLGDTPPGPDAATYPGVLIKRGFHAADAVLAVLKGWLNLLELLRPDFLIADYSPTAVLAARVGGVLAGAMGTGFFCPPRTTPLPVIFGQSTPPELQQEVEESMLGAINGALARVGATPLRVLADMFPPVEDVLVTFPELDHYGAQVDRTYWGALDLAFGTARPPWPPGDGPRIFAYLQAGFPGYARMVEDLHRLGLPTILHARGRGPEVPSGPTLALSGEPIDMDHVLEEATLVICHASHGTVAQALLRGVPLMMLPRDNEQQPVRDRVVAMGAGVSASRGSEGPPDYAALIERAVQDPQLLVGAAAFAGTYAGFDAGAAGQRIIDFYEAALAQHRS